MASVDSIVDTLIKSIETATNEELAQTYNYIVSCSDCSYWHDCQNEHTCYVYILEKLERGD